MVFAIESWTFLSNSRTRAAEHSVICVKSVGSTPVQCVDHLVPLCSETFRFSVLGVELSRDLLLGVCSL